MIIVDSLGIRRIIGVMLLVSTLLTSCMPGKWDDVIELSQKELIVESGGGDYCIFANDFTLSGLYVLDENGHFVPVDKNCGRKYEGDDLRQLNMYLSSEWVEVRRVPLDNGKVSMNILVGSNDGNSNRSCYISIYLGDYQDHVTLTQFASK